MYHFLSHNFEHNSLLVLTVGRVSEKVWTAMSDLTNAAVDVSLILISLITVATYFTSATLVIATDFDFFCCSFISLTSQE